MHTKQTERKTLNPVEDCSSYEKRYDVKTASLCNKRNPTNANDQILKKTQNEMNKAYLKQQIEYIQDQINKIRDSVEGRLSRIVWQTLNGVSKRKSTARAKLKAAWQEERILMWKQPFKNLSGYSPKITEEPITKIIYNQLDIKIGQFTQELDAILTKIKNRKAAGRDEIALKA